MVWECAEAKYVFVCVQCKSQGERLGWLCNWWEKQGEGGIESMMNEAAKRDIVSVMKQERGEDVNTREKNEQKGWEAETRLPPLFLVFSVFSLFPLLFPWSFSLPAQHKLLDQEPLTPRSNT